MLRAGPILALLALLPLALAEEPALRVAAVEPFALDLWPDRAPATAVVVDRKHPLALSAALGQEVAGVLSLAASGPVPECDVETAPLRTGEGEIAAEAVAVRVIRTVRRTRPQGVVAGARYPDRAGRGIDFPDVLVRDEPGFLAAAAARTYPLPDEDEEAPVRLAAMRPGDRKYLLVTVSVPPTAKPGEYEGSLRIGPASAPVRLTVLPFSLEPARGVVLGVANDLAEPAGDHLDASLELLARIGMNATRITDLTSVPEPAATLHTLEEHGFGTVVQTAAPRRAADLARIPKELDFFCRGLDESRTSHKVGTETGRLERHVELSARLHGMGARVMAGGSYERALALEKRKEPLDWASYDLDLARLGDKDDPHRKLLGYLDDLRKEFFKSDWAEEPAPPRGKRPWRETVHWPLGLDHYPFFGRLLFGFFLFANRLDGAEAVPLNRTRGMDAFADGPEFVAALAHPGRTTIYSTYCLEAVREGVVDLRHAQQAHRAIVRLLASDDPARQRRGRRLRRELADLVEPWGRLVQRGKRIDLVLENPEGRLRQTRDDLAKLILEAAE